MFTSTDLKAIVTEARPVIERQLDDAALVAGFRETVTAKGGDWSQVKALVKAMIQDERNETGGDKKVRTHLSKAENALGYADMLGLGNLNEKNSFAEDADADLAGPTALDPELLRLLVEGSKSGAGLAIIRDALSTIQSTAARTGRAGQPQLGADAYSPATDARDRASGYQAPPVDTHSAAALTADNEGNNPALVVAEDAPHVFSASHFTNTPSGESGTAREASLDASKIQSGEAQQEGAAVGESPMPDPADVSGLHIGGEHVARANPANAVGGAPNEASPAPSSVIAFEAKPRDGVYSADWLRRHGRCQHADACEVRPGRLCRECSGVDAIADQPGEIPHHGSIGA